MNHESRELESEGFEIPTPESDKHALERNTLLEQPQGPPALDNPPRDTSNQINVNHTST